MGFRCLRRHGTRGQGEEPLGPKPRCLPAYRDGDRRSRAQRQREAAGTNCDTTGECSLPAQPQVSDPMRQTEGCRAGYVCTVARLSRRDALGICESSDVTKTCRLGLTSKDKGHWVAPEAEVNPVALGDDAALPAVTLACRVLSGLSELCSAYRAQVAGPMLQLKGPLLLRPSCAGWMERIHFNGPRAHKVTVTATHAFPHLDDSAACPLSLMRALPGLLAFAVVTVSVSHPQPAIPSRMMLD